MNPCEILLMYLYLSPCIQDPTLRARGITDQTDIEAFRQALLRCKAFNIPISFLPCPECHYLGREREPGHFLDRLNTPAFFEVLASLEREVRDHIQVAGTPYGIVGVDSSPTCGVQHTYYGSRDGSAPKIAGRGVFFARFPEIRAVNVYDLAKWRIYLAAPLFSEAERIFNARLAEYLSSLCFQVHLPQEVGDTSPMRDEDEHHRIFSQNLIALDTADLVVAVIDGSDADSGTSWEIGYAYAHKKIILSIRTDFRMVGANERVNLMLEESSVVLTRTEDLIHHLPCPIPRELMTNHQGKDTDNPTGQGRNPP